jgi:hypothetical protein
MRRANAVPSSFTGLVRSFAIPVNDLFNQALRGDCTGLIRSAIATGERLNSFIWCRLPGKERAPRLGAFFHPHSEGA